MGKTRTMIAVLGAVCALLGCGDDDGSDGTVDVDGGGRTDAGGETDGGATDEDAGSVVTPGPRLRALAAGHQATCALLDDGTVRCWGDNREGQLGDGTTTSRVRPAAVSGLDDAIAITVGYEVACAVREGGSAVCWGSGTNGKLGNGGTDDAPVPVAVTGLTDAVSIHAGQSTVCAVRSDGTVWCWGRGGSLGSSSASADSPVPVQVEGLTDVAHLDDAGESGSSSLASHVCGARGDGSAFCWGPGGDGQNGDGTLDDRRAPVAVSGVSDATGVAAGLSHACAIRSDGTDCWGFGALVGDGSTERQLTPVRVTTSETFVELTAGWEHTCGRTATGGLFCWGRNGRGQIGDAMPIEVLDARPTPVAAAIDAVELVAAGTSHTCAYDADQVTRCWGANEYGELGSGTPSSSFRTSVPTPVEW